MPVRQSVGRKPLLASARSRPSRTALLTATSFATEEPCGAPHAIQEAHRSVRSLRIAAVCLERGKGISDRIATAVAAPRLVAIGASSSRPPSGHRTHSEREDMSLCEVAECLTGFQNPALWQMHEIACARSIGTVRAPR